jgi:hypothetical protein
MLSIHIVFDFILDFINFFPDSLHHLVGKSAEHFTVGGSMESFNHPKARCSVMDSLEKLAVLFVRIVTEDAVKTEQLVASSYAIRVEADSIYQKVRVFFAGGSLSPGVVRLHLEVFRRYLSMRI